MLVYNKDDFDPYEVYDGDDVIISLNKEELKNMQHAIEQFCINGGFFEVEQAGRLNRVICDFLKDTEN